MFILVISGESDNPNRKMQEDRFFVTSRREHSLIDSKHAHIILRQHLSSSSYPNFYCLPILRKLKRMIDIG
jgi:hypothetical protein